MNNNKGSALSQYGIIIFLVALAIIPVIYLVGKNIVGQFEYFSKVFGDRKSTANQISNNAGNQTAGAANMKAGSLGGTPDKPVQQCTGDSCAIDFGNFILQGIPQDFGDYLQTHSTSGGQDKLASLLLQMAEQLEEQGLNDQASDIRDIANLGHYIAEIEKNYETIANDCKAFDNFGDCFANNAGSAYYVPNKNIPDNVQNLIPEFAHIDFMPYLDNTVHNGLTMTYTNQATEIGYAILQLNDYKKMGIKNDYLDEWSTENPANAIAYKYNKIINDPAVSDSVKNVTQTMLQYMSTMAVEHNTRALILSGVSAQASYVDISTGTYEYKSISDVTLDAVTKPQTTLKTHISSAVICVSGRHRTTGTSCYE